MRKPLWQYKRKRRRRGISFRVLLLYLKSIAWTKRLLYREMNEKLHSTQCHFPSISNVPHSCFVCYRLSFFKRRTAGRKFRFFPLDQQDKKLMHYYSRFFMQYANFKIWIPLELLFCECNVWLERETERWLLKCTFGFAVRLVISNQNSLPLQ